MLPKLVSLTGRYLKYELVFILTIPSFNPNQILLLLSSNIDLTLSTRNPEFESKLFHQIW